MDLGTSVHNKIKKKLFSRFSCRFLISVIFSNLNYNCSIFWDLTKPPGAILKSNLLPKIVLTFHCLNKLGKRMLVKIKGIYRLNTYNRQNRRMLFQKEFEPIDLPFKTLILFIQLLWASERFQKCLLHTEVIFSLQK